MAREIVIGRILRESAERFGEVYAKLLGKLIAEYRGMENARPRKEFLFKEGWVDMAIFRSGENISERTFRAAYSWAGAAECQAGIFWPEKKEEVLLVLADLHKRIKALKTRCYNLIEIHRELFDQEEIQKEKDYLGGLQLELFE
jgi:hypothetical protein